VADFNRDGHPDILITNRSTYANTGGQVSVYVWDVYNNVTTTPLIIPTTWSGKNIPLIADVNNNGKPDIIIQCDMNNTNDDMRVYEYDNGAFIYLWGIAPNEDSYSNSASLFDFNQDGLNEVLITDQSQIRIFNGSGKSHITQNDTLTVYQLAAFTFSEVTIMQYPVIADVDDDVAAEIIACGSGTLNIFKSSGVFWAPARPVWNQYSYNPVYVNDDLTIPAHPLNPATFFVKKDGSYHQPFNNILQQATLLNGEGKMLAYGPNFEFDANSVSIEQTGSTVAVSFNVLNTGDADYSGPLTISTYVFDNGLFSRLDSRPVTVNAERGIPVAVSYTITNFPANLVASSTLQIRINEDDGGFPLPECTYSGNYSQELFGAPNYALCGNETRTLYFYPQNSPYTYYWYNDASTSNNVGIGDSYSFTKNPVKEVERFYVKVHDGNDWLNNEVYSFGVFLVPDTLSWTGNGGNSDWNDPDNWDNPGYTPDGACTECAIYRIPGPCTNVAIPDGKSYYPDLSLSLPTIYTDFSCSRIWFSHGGEVARTDLLTYVEAYVELTVNSNQWYLFSPPLHHFYTGDIYVNNPNPFLDGYFVNPMFFNVLNPQTGVLNQVYEWTGSFNTADTLLNAGRGMAIWIDNHNPDYDNHDPVTFRFPKSDPFYYYYSGGDPVSQTPNLERGLKNRFIYEPLSGDSVLLNASPPGTSANNAYILVGNPFMAHLNFSKFAFRNRSEIEDEYKLAFAPAPVGSEGKVNALSSFQRVGGSSYISTVPDNLPALDSLIAPMQSFIVVSKKGSEPLHLYAHISDTQTAPGIGLRSGRSGSFPQRMLGITAYRDSEASKAVLILSEEGSAVYVPDEDSRKLFSGGTPKMLAVYTRSQDGYALDINTSGGGSQTIPLGLRTSLHGEIRLRIEGQESFGNDVRLLLHDTKLGQVIDLFRQDEYVFYKAEDALFLDNRFYLIFDYSPSLNEGAYSGISVRSVRQGIHILSNGGSPLENVRIFDVRGKCLVNEDLEVSGFCYEAGAPGVYIVKVHARQGSETKKVVVK
jgi:hypothetical protein